MVYFLEGSLKVIVHTYSTTIILYLQYYNYYNNKESKTSLQRRSIPTVYIAGTF